MKKSNIKIDTISHSGWESYYKEQNGMRAWNGVPDEYLLENLVIFCPRQGLALLILLLETGETRLLS
ncbi:hypothetical protein [Candidatus Spongiihabitans sp.]|uniref:hypothetical protein n=1 Tax=Candidatus Spongiihabitans sp. TaxID=3101308 RepID=UPI003C6FFEDE